MLLKSNLCLLQLLYLLAFLILSAAFNIIDNNIAPKDSIRRGHLPRSGPISLTAVSLYMLNGEFLMYSYKPMAKYARCSTRLCLGPLHFYLVLLGIFFSYILHCNTILIRFMNVGMNEIKNMMLNNFLLLNSEKTEVLSLGTKTSRDEAF